MIYRPFEIRLEQGGNSYVGKAIPISHLQSINKIPNEFSVTLNGIFRGVFTCCNNTWQSTSLTDELLVNAVGRYIEEWYQ